MIRTYTELSKLKTFEERFEYLKLGGAVGIETFGRSRYLNQLLYHCSEWSTTRHGIIIRDNGCDLGIIGREIFRRLLIHHINPITEENILNRDDCIFDPENLITTWHNTHNAIHYGDESFLATLPKERQKGDTAPWLTPTTIT